MPVTLSLVPRTTHLLLVAAATVLAAVPSRPLLAQARRAITWDDVAALRAVADPQLSPDGSRVLYTVRTTDVAANRRVPTSYVIAVAGGEPRRWPDDSVRATEARWSPDGSWVAYVAQGQLWVARADGSAPRRLTSLNGGATGPVWSPAGDRIAFTSTVYPECSDDACNAARDKARDESAVRARVVESLLYRHWSSWGDGSRSHLFVVAIDGSTPRDLTAGAPYDVPVPPFGGSEGYAFSPDGRELAYTAKDAGREAAWSTDLNVYTVDVTGGAPTVITAANRGADQNPVYSPDGRFIAYASQARAGFEADRWRLLLYDRSTRTVREGAAGWDRNAESYFFAPDGSALYIGSGDRGRDKLFRLPLDRAGQPAGAPSAIISAHNNLGFTVSRDGRTIAWVRDAAHQPPEVWVRTDLPSRKPVGRERQLTHENDAALRAFSLNPAEDFWFAGAQGDSVHGFVIKPPNFDPGRRYPVVFLIHGGPQGAWLDNWGGRWSFQLFASVGAAVVAINPRGSTGYGQAFTDGVTGDWGGRAYEDLMKGLDAVLERHAWLDGTRVAAAGGSYGGYMVNWIAGHSDRFKALVSHAGVFNLENMYGATEEIWFTDWEFGGPYWQPKAMAEQYRRWSPHLAAGQMKTPMLVVHGELDYRVPYYESVSLFTALQRQGVPSRLVVYPDEGHWILKPQNSRLWYQEVLGWIGKYVGAKVTS